MSLPRKYRHLLIWLVCITVLVMRVGAAHVHLCLDGSEPAVSLHFADSGVHDLDHPNDAGMNPAESDSDVSVPGDALIKSGVGDADIPLLAVSLYLILLLVPVTRPLRVDWDPPQVRSAARTQIRPPLRGPPA
jgi:hypothetical protein